jgi:hypothetical protein
MTKRLSPTVSAIIKRAIHNPFSLRPADIATVRAEDRGTAADMVDLWRAACRWDAYKKKYRQRQG